MKITRLIIGIFSAALVLTSCARYSYDGKSYASREEFVAAADKAVADYISSIESLDEEMWPKVYFGRPNDETLMEKGIVQMGTDLFSMKKFGLKQANKYYDSVVDAMKRRGISADIEVIVTNGRPLDSKYAPSLYVVMETLGQDDWYFLDSDGERELLELDPYRVKETEKIDDLLYLLEGMN